MFMTVDRLTAEADACVDVGQVDAFGLLFPDGVEVTAAVCVEHAAVFDWDWAAEHFLSNPARAEYVKARATARAEYNKVQASARAEYVKACAPVRAAYDDACATALSEYDAVHVTARAAYDKVCAPDLAAYDEACASAQAVYDEACATVFGRLIEQEDAS